MIKKTALKHRLSRLACYFLVFLFSTFVVFGIALSIDTTRRTLGMLTVDLVNKTTPFDIELEQLTTRSVGEWSFRRLTIKHDNSLLLRMHTARVNIAISALLKGQLRIQNVSAEKLDVYAVSAAKGSSSQTSKTKHQGDLPKTPLVVNALNIASFQFHSTEFSTPEYQIAAKLEFQTNQFILGTLNVDDRNNRDDAFILTIAGQNPSHIQVKASAQEAKGGFAGGLARLPKTSSISMTMNAAVFLSAQRVQIKLNTLDLALGDYRASVVSAIDYQRDHGALRIHPSTLSVGDSKNIFSGEYASDSGTFHLATHRLPMDIASLWLPELQSGLLNTDLTLSIENNTIHATGNLDATAAYKGQRLSLAYSGQGSATGMDIQRFALAAGSAKLTASGVVDFVSDKTALDLRLNGLSHSLFELVNVPVPENLTFVIDEARGNVTGKIGDPDVSVDLRVHGKYHERPVEISTTLGGNQRQINIHSATLGSDMARASAVGELDLAAKTMDLSVTTRDFPIAMLNTFAVRTPEKLSALVSTEVHLWGPWHSPLAEGKATATGRYEHYPFGLELTGSYREKIVDLTHLRWHIASKIPSISSTQKPHAEPEALEKTSYTSQLLGKGTLNLKTKGIKGDVALVNFPISLLEAGGINMPQGLNLSVDGTLVAEGAYDSPKAALDLTANGRYQEIDINLRAEARYENKALDIKNVYIDADDKRVVSAVGTLKGDDFSLGLSIADVPSTLWQSLGLSVPINNIEARISASGTVYNPDIDGVILYEGWIADVNSEGEKTDTPFAIKTHITTKALSTQTLPVNGDKNLLVNTQITKSGHGAGTIQAVLPVSPYGDYLRQPRGSVPLAGSLTSSFSLDVLGAFLEKDVHTLHGEFNTKLVFSGNTKTPKVNGIAALNDAGYENRINGTAIDNIHCSVRAKQRELVFTDCTASDTKSGRYTLTGNLHAPVRGDGKIDIQFALRDAQIVERSDIDSRATGNLRLRGDVKAMDLTGRLDISPLTINLNSSFGGDIPAIEVTDVYADKETTSTDSKNTRMPEINLNVDIAAANQAFLRGRGLDVELSGDIALRGTAKRPIYTGEFETIRGSFEVFSKKFTLASGKVRFANNAVSLFIEGKYTKLSQEITAQIAGTPSNLDIKLSSVPAMAQDEIIAYLIFGKSVLSITPFEAVRLASEIQSLRNGGAASFDPISKTRDFLGVDSLSVESAEGGESGVSVGVGKYLNERVYLEVERSPNPVQPWKGRVEIELAPNLNLESATGGSDGVEGARLIWKHDY